MRAAILIVAVPLLAAAAGCFELHPPQEPTQVILAIASVPADVACVRITAAGTGRTVAREIAVASGEAVNESFSGLPLGTVTFLAEAFPGTCQAVTKVTVPTWVSESMPVSVVLGRMATVALTLHRNGRARVNVDFADEPACSPAAQICLNDSECCSRACVRGSCGASDGGSADATGN